MTRDDGSLSLPREERDRWTCVSRLASGEMFSPGLS